MAQRMTKKDLEVLVFIALRYPRNTTLRDIANNCSCYLNGAYYIVKKLTKFGMVRRNFKGKTGIVLSCSIEIERLPGKPDSLFDF